MSGTPVRGNGGDGPRALRRALLVVAIGVILSLLPFVSGLVGALILFTIMRGPHVRLSRVLPARLAAFAIAIGLLVIILVPGGWLISQLASEAGEAVQALRTGQLDSLIARTPFGQSAKELMSLAGGAVSSLSGRAVAVFGNAALTVLNLVIALVGLYYLLIEGEALWQRTKGFLAVSGAIADQLAARFASVTEALLIGTAFTAALQGTVVGASFAVVGLQPALLWGFVTACTSLFPLVGSALVWLPGVVILVLQHRMGAALFVGIMGAGVASNLDNVVRIFVYKRVSGIHPMATLVGAFAGVRLLGVVGAFVGPLLLSYFFELLRMFEDSSRAESAGS